jgi:protein TonB
MNYAQQQADPRRHVIGVTVVVLFHLLVVYALVTGLAKKVIDVVRAPIETKVIEEVKKPPPPPEVVLPPPPKLEAPPPPFIPPPEIQIATPPPPAPTISATTSTPPPAPVTIAPTRPPIVVAAPPAPPAPIRVGVVCPNSPTVMGDSAFPAEATRKGVEKGEATMEWIVTPSGEIKDVKVLNATNPIFAKNSAHLISSYKCVGQGRDVVVRQVFSYKLE